MLFVPDQGMTAKFTAIMGEGSRMLARRYGRRVLGSGGEGEACVEVEFEGSVGVDVAVDEWGEGSAVGGAEDEVVVFCECLLDHERVDVDECCLE